MSESPLVAAYGVVLRSALRGEDLHPGVEATPQRAAKAILEMTDGYEVDVAGLFTVFEGNGYDEMVIERGIPFVSLCEHHMLPFTGHAHVAYIPNGKVVGLSKLVRLVDAFSRRLQIQERMTMQIADALNEHLNPQGVAVVAEAEHSCMSCRGVRRPGVVAVTSRLTGLLKDDARARAEALALMGY